MDHTAITPSPAPKQPQEVPWDASRAGGPPSPQACGGGQHPTLSPGQRSPGPHQDADTARPSVRPSFKFKDQHGDKKGKGQRGAGRLRAHWHAACGEPAPGVLAGHAPWQAGSMPKHRHRAAWGCLTCMAKRWQEPGATRLCTDMPAPPDTCSPSQVPWPCGPGRLLCMPLACSCRVRLDTCWHLAPTGRLGALSSACSGPCRCGW